MPTPDPSRISTRRVAGALAASIAIWIAFVLLRALSARYLDWPAGSDPAFGYFAVAVSSVPLLLLVLDFVASRGGSIGSKWVTVDFREAVIEQPDVREESFGLPDNVVAEEERLTDSGGMKIKASLKKAATHDLLRIDLKDGNAWWVTRLLAVCAGAVEVGAPQAIVFVGRRDNKDGVFLGWGRPRALLQAMLDASSDYEKCYYHAKAVTQQLTAFNPGVVPSPLLPGTSAPGANAQNWDAVQFHPDVSAHQYQSDINPGATLATVLISSLRCEATSSVSPEKSLEDPPDRLTVSRLDALFAHCLHRGFVDRAWSNDRQITSFLDTGAPYVALVRDGRYEAMLVAERGQRAILRNLFEQVQRGAPAS